MSALLLISKLKDLLGHHFEPVLPRADPVLQLSFFMIVVCQVVLGMSRRGCNFLLNMVQYIVHLTLLRGGSNLSQYDQKLLSDIPVDFRTTEQQFHLEPKCVIAAVCPKADCHATYDPTFANDSPIPIYPKTCSYQPFIGGSKCGTKLLQSRRVNGKNVDLPIKPFVRISFKDWLAGLLSRQGFEKKMDAAWKGLNVNNVTEMSDIFDGEVLQDFKGCDGKHFSLGGDEGRYVFSLCVDYFNPLGNKQAGKKKSVGLVSLVCLNLPPDMRYKAENMFLYGVIPGPEEPPLDCLNHYLKFLVDELLDCWAPGIRFSRTYECYYGRVVQCALVCLVCDLLAARKTAGFAGIRHNQICAFCYCTRKDQGLGHTNTSDWKHRTNEEYRKSALRYQNAENLKTRNEIVKETGIRWSELLRLPYFDPSRFVVVDAMHNLFLGLIQEHFEILGIKLNQADEELDVISIEIPSEGMSDLDSSAKKAMLRLIKILQSPLNKKLATPVGYDKVVNQVQNCHRSALMLACRSLPGVDLSPPVTAQKKTKMNKYDLARALLAWVSVFCRLPSYCFL